ncbi:MAG TPA: hypothetical protein P5026_05515 [Kiritimatiellia bacterium]|jgi:hypothetical protein|nr:hypothetical protein [Kiritimatiellia bacterium]
MQVTLTDGVTPVVICHGAEYAGQAGYYVGPLGADAAETEWTVRPKRPIRGETEIPLDGRLAVRTYPLQVAVECASDEAALALRDALPDALPRGDAVTLQVLHSPHALDTYSNAVVQKLRILRDGVTLLIDYQIRVGARVRTDPNPA